MKTAYFISFLAKMNFDKFSFYGHFRVQFFLKLISQKKGELKKIVFIFMNISFIALFVNQSQ